MVILRAPSRTVRICRNRRIEDFRGRHDVVGVEHFTRHLLQRTRRIAEPVRRIRTRKWISGKILFRGASGQQTGRRRRMIEIEFQCPRLDRHVAAGQLPRQCQRSGAGLFQGLELAARQTIVLGRQRATSVERRLRKGEIVHSNIVSQLQIRLMQGHRSRRRPTGDGRRRTETHREI